MSPFRRVLCAAYISVYLRDSLLESLLSFQIKINCWLPEEYSEYDVGRKQEIKDCAEEDPFGVSQLHVSV